MALIRPSIYIISEHPNKTSTPKVSNVFLKKKENICSSKILLLIMRRYYENERGINQPSPLGRK